MARTYVVNDWGGIYRLSRKQYIDALKALQAGARVDKAGWRHLGDVVATLTDMSPENATYLLEDVSK